MATTQKRTSPERTKSLHPNSLLNPQQPASQTLPTVLPVLKVTDIQARQADIIWTYGNRDPRYLFPYLSYQLSKAESDALIFDAAYEGDEPVVTITELKPLTTYMLKLRIALTSAVSHGTHPDLWSKTYTEISFTTKDESILTKVTSQLVRAVFDADVAKVTTILNEYGKQLSMETRDKNNKTLLMLACQSGSPDIVRLLLSMGASTTATTRSGKTALSIAVTYGSLKAAEAILQHDPEQAKIPDLGGSTPLMWACENAGSNVRTGVQLVELLLKQGVDVNQEDPRGQTAFDRLLQTANGNAKVAQLLLMAGARIIHQVDKKRPMTSLMVAALNGHKEIVKELLDKCNVDATVKTEHGTTARDFADTNGHTAIVDTIDERIKIIIDASLNEENPGGL